MCKKLSYATKIGGKPELCTREQFASLFHGIIRKHRMVDGTRVFATANGHVLYVQYQTAAQRANWI
jgi:hypothetical protein